MKRQMFLPIIHEHQYFCFPESVGWYSNRPEHSVLRRSTEENNYNLHLIVSGKGYLVSEGITYTLQQGDALFYFPLQEQNYYSDPENPWEVLWVHFNGKHLNEFFIEKGFHKSHVWTLKLFKALQASIIALLDEAEEYTILHPPILSTLTYGIIAEFISQAYSLTPNKGNELFDRIIDILPKMQNSSPRSFKLEEWSDRLGISTFYFCKSFKKVTGMTPSDFIKLCRLQKAKQLLLEKSDWSIKQIAIEAGYPSLSYFGRLFLENEGVTPMKYRKIRS